MHTYIYIYIYVDMRHTIMYYTITWYHYSIEARAEHLHFAFYGTLYNHTYTVHIDLMWLQTRTRFAHQSEQGTCIAILRVVTYIYIYIYIYVQYVCIYIYIHTCPEYSYLPWLVRISDRPAMTSRLQQSNTDDQKMLFLRSGKHARASLMLMPMIVIHNIIIIIIIIVIIVCIYIYIYIHKQLYVYMYICICICVYIYIYIYIYIYTHT